MTQQSSRLCMFCGSGKLTKEHIWPAWAAEHLPDAHARDETTRLFMGGTVPTDDRTVTRQGSIKHKKLRVVCGPCNNEWMSKIEDDAKPVLLPMLLGQNLFLEEKAQGLLARWVALKVMVAEQSRPADAVISQEERQAFMMQRTIPNGLKIEIAQCGEPPWDTALDRHAAHLFPVDKRPADLVAAASRKNIQTTTFGIGQLLVHCIVRAADSIDLASLVAFSTPLVNVWPLTGSAIVWPPSFRLSAAEGHRVATRMNTLTSSGTVKYLA